MLTRLLSITLLVCFLAILGAACQSSGASAPAAPTSTSEPAIRQTPTASAPSAAPPAGAPASINGWVWHDLCAVSGEGSGPVRPSAGCIQTGDLYRADGVMAGDEPAIGGVEVQLGQGECPASSTLTSTTTITTDLSYSFTGLEPGTYCVAIDPLQEPNPAILLPGSWTYPALVDGPISTTVVLRSGENQFDVNFGWDYQFLPPVDQACVYRASLVSDVSVPENTLMAPGSRFTKTWRLRNEGTCTWGPGLSLHSLFFMSGEAMGAPSQVRLPSNTPPGGSVDISINMIAPDLPGVYRGEWMLHVADGPLLGVGPDMQMPLVVQIIVGTKGTGG